MNNEQAWVELLGILISGIVGIVTAIITTNSRIKKERHEDQLARELREQKQENQLEQITRRLDQHNEYGKKFAECNTSLLKLSKDVEWIKKEINGQK